jgi:hypothetical protein
MPRALVFFLFFTALVSAFSAESFYERELQQLTEQHDKAVAAAVLPINRSYQTALEQLLVRTTRNKDLDASAKVVAALRAIGAAPTVPAVPEVAPAAGAPLKSQIEELLTPKVWVHAGQFHYKFTKEGRLTLVEGNRRGKFQVDEKTGFVAFNWDGGAFPGEGIQFNAGTLTFTHNRGGTFLPSAK